MNSREGSDLFDLYKSLHGKLVSIHAPARGATHAPLVISLEPYVSIHAPARGATGLLSSFSIMITFQFTLPRGERRDSCTPKIHDSLFQFTLPRGERLLRK